MTYYNYVLFIIVVDPSIPTYVHHKTWMFLKLLAIGITVFIIVFMLLLAYPPLVDQYAWQLREVYNKTLGRFKDSNINKYPAAGPSAFRKNMMPFIPLISIKITNYSKNDADYLHRASVEELLQNDEKEKIQFDDILKPVSQKRLRFVLIEGEPGIGKSTLAQNLVLTWVKRSDKILSNFKIVIFIQLRFKIYQEGNEMANLFIKTKQKIDMEKLQAEIESSEGAGVLWILDGFDELPSDLRNNDESIFVQLIKGDIFPKSTVIVTSRPVATHLLLEFIYDDDTKHISIRGFDPNSTLEYAFKYFGGSSMVSEFYFYYNGNPTIERMLYNPMNCYIVCTIFKNLTDNRPQHHQTTMTWLYNEYVRILLKRHLLDSRAAKMTSNIPKHVILKSNFNSTDNITLNLSNYWKSFSYLLERAHDGARKQKYIFGNEFINIEKLSMMDTIISFSATAADQYESSSFIHTTLQEYLAAIYLVNNPESCNFTYNELENNQNLKVVVTFYTGLQQMIGRKLDSATVSLLLKYVVLDYQNEEVKVSQLMLRCLYEHSSLFNHTDFSFLNYYKITPSTNFRHIVKPLTLFDYFICGYILAHHDIVIYTLFRNLHDVKYFNKGLELQHVKGRLNLVIIHFGIKVLNEILNEVPRSVPVALFLSCRFSKDDNSCCQFLSNISKFELLQGLTLRDIKLSCSASVEPSLLELQNFKSLVIYLNRYDFSDNDLKVTKKLIAPGRPVKNLYLESQSAINRKTLKLIVQTSLKKLELKRWTQSNSNCKNVENVVWYNSSNSLKITGSWHNILHILSVMPSINLTTLTLYPSVKTKSQCSSLIHIELVSNFILRGNLRMLYSTLKRSYAALESLILKLYRTHIKNCYKVKLNNLIHARVIVNAWSII